MSASRKSAGLVGVFAHHDALIDSIKKVRKAGFTIREVYSPVPSHELIEVARPGRSPVRFLTAAGAVTGLVSGMALAIWSSLEWNLIVGGKPVTAIAPFMVVGFELLILCGALATLTGMVLFARLPAVKFPDTGFRPEFTRDRFGMWLEPPSKRVEEAREMLEQTGAVDVHTLGGDA